MKHFALPIVTLIIMALPAGTQAAVTEIPVIEWTRQFGTSGEDHAESVTVDGNGNIYLTGEASGNLHGNIGNGGRDVFLAKYDSDGISQWTRQLGSPYSDRGYDVSVDNDGNPRVGGYTSGDFDGHTSEGEDDAILAKYDANGNKMWTRQLGTSARDFGRGMALDSEGNAYITGITAGKLGAYANPHSNDMFLVKYNTDGVRQWTQQLGDWGQDEGKGVSVDSDDNVYVTGVTNGVFDGESAIGNTDAFLIKRDKYGGKIWTKLLGSTGKDSGYGISVNGNGDAYVVGMTYGNTQGHINQGHMDVFLAKYDTNGTEQWIRQLGTAGLELGHGVASDEYGNAYITGWTAGGLDGNESAGGDDVFVTKFDTNGTKLWTCQFGTSSRDWGYEVSVSPEGDLYVVGGTYGGLDGYTNAGEQDIFLVKISTIPEPSTLILLATGALGILLHTRRRR